MVTTHWNWIEECATEVKAHHVHTEEGNKEEVVCDAGYEDANCFWFGEIEAKEEEKLAKEEGDHEGEEDLGRLVSKLLQPAVQEHVEKETNQAEEGKNYQKNWSTT